MINFLTEEEISDLRFYLLISTNYRLREKKALDDLSAELNENGTVKYAKMQDNSNFWEKLNETIENIIKKL